MAKYDISNTDKIIDARDVQKRIEELESEYSPDLFKEEICAFHQIDIGHFDETDDTKQLLLMDEWVDSIDPATSNSSNEDLQDIREELQKLRAFAEEIGDDNLRHGETLIHEDHFRDYAEEIAADLYGAEVTDAKWPFSYIDWEKAADELKHDYTGADFDGETYYFRS